MSASPPVPMLSESDSSSSSTSSCKTTVAPNPHGMVSLRRLTRMKVVDAHSVHVFGFRSSCSSPEVLSGPSMFGKFGAIHSLRIIQTPHKASISASASTRSTSDASIHPVQVLVRFADLPSAILATAWCRVINKLHCQPGYGRYCVKFACGKPCHRKQCAKLHRWAEVAPAQ